MKHALVPLIWRLIKESTRRDSIQLFSHPLFDLDICLCLVIARCNTVYQKNLVVWSLGMRFHQRPSENLTKTRNPTCIELIGHRFVPFILFCLLFLEFFLFLQLFLFPFRQLSLEFRTVSRSTGVLTAVVIVVRVARAPRVAGIQGGWGRRGLRGDKHWHIVNPSQKEPEIHPIMTYRSNSNAFCCCWELRKGTLKGFYAGLPFHFFGLTERWHNWDFVLTEQKF